MNRSRLPIPLFSARVLISFVLGATGLFLAVLGSTDIHRITRTETRSGASVTAESCNGRDDDGDGQIDEGLGTFSAGLGACRTTVPACTAGVLGATVPAIPSTNVDGPAPNGVDDNCNGAVDEDSSCVRVALTGDDATGNGSAAFPFLTIQAAINYSAANASAPKRICVAAGAACGATGTYAGGVVMANGISVYGGYQSTSWARCTNSTVRIQPGVAEGVRFPAAVVDPTTLFNFTIERATLPTTSGVTVEGAQNVLLASVIIGNTPSVQHSFGVNVINGGEATVAASRVTGGAGSIETIGVRVVNSQVAVSGNCLSLNAPGQCDDVAGATNRGILGRLTTGPGESYAVLLDNSPLSVVEQSSLSANASDIGAMVRIKGNAGGIRVRANIITAFGGVQDSHGIWAEDCSDASPWLVDNYLITAAGTSSTSRSSAIRAIGSCHPVVESNSQISGGTEGQSSAAIGVHCGQNVSLVGSECVIDNNVLIKGGSGSASSTGILCDDGSCARIERNTVSNSGVTNAAFGVRLGRTAVRVETNVISAGCGANSSTGVMATGSGSRIANNFINGGFGCAPPPPLSIGILVVNAADPGEVDVHSNTIVGRGSTSGSCTSVGLQVDATLSPPPKGIFRNNIIHGGDCNTRFGVRESSAAADPRVFQNNDIVPAGAATALYLNEGSTPIMTAAGVNALADMMVSGTLAQDPLFVSYPANLHLQSGSPLRDAGTSQGAPATDIDEELRDPATPDIGADEFEGALLRLVAITRQNMDVVVSFEGVAHRTYRLERKLAMTDMTWDMVDDLTLGASGLAQITDPNSISFGKAFYQVLLLP